jgi:uncharacterized membrane-anchored protein
MKILTRRTAKAFAIFTLFLIIMQVAVIIAGTTFLPGQIVIAIETLLMIIIVLAISVLIRFFRKRFKDIKEIERKTEV